MAPEGSPFQLLGTDLARAVLRAVSKASGGHAHSLVCRAWRDMAPGEQEFVQVRPRAVMRAAKLVEELQKFPNLTRLCLNKTSLCVSIDEFLRGVGRLRDLKVLEVPNGSSLTTSGISLDRATEGGLHSLFSGCSRLRQISLQEQLCGCDSLPDSVTRLTDLEKLEFTAGIPGLDGRDGNVFAHELRDAAVGFSRVPDVGLPVLSNLRHLSITLKSNGAASNLLSQLPPLTSLDLHVLRTVTALPEAVPGCNSVRSLTLWCAPEEGLTWRGWTLHRGLHLRLLGSFSGLKKLRLLSSCTRLPDAICELSQLTTLELHCPSLTELPEIGNLARLQQLTLVGCASLTRVPSSFSHLKASTSLKLAFDLDFIAEGTAPLLLSISRLSLDTLEGHSLPSQITALAGLRVLEVTNSRSLVSMGSALSQLTRLTRLHVKGCPKLKHIGSQAGELALLRSFQADHCPALHLPRDIGNMESLEDFTLLGSGPMKLPPSFTDLPKLQSLALGGMKLTNLPSDLGKLQCLEEISFCDLPKLRELPASMGQLINLRRLRLVNNPKLEGLPGGLKMLKKLELVCVDKCPLLHDRNLLEDRLSCPSTNWKR